MELQMNGLIYLIGLIVVIMFVLSLHPIIAGAIAAAALALVLHSFALAIGLAVSSTAPTWRDASFALVALSGLYVMLAALASYGLGGYLAGLMRARLRGHREQRASRPISHRRPVAACWP